MPFSGAVLAQTAPSKHPAGPSNEAHTRAVGAAEHDGVWLPEAVWGGDSEGETGVTMEEVEADLDVGLEPKEAEAEELDHAFWNIAKLLGTAASLQPEFKFCVGIIGRMGVRTQGNPRAGRGCSLVGGPGSKPTAEHMCAGGPHEIHQVHPGGLAGTPRNETPCAARRY